MITWVKKRVKSNSVIITRMPPFRISSDRAWLFAAGLGAVGGAYFWLKLARLPSDGGLSAARLGLLLMMGAAILALAVFGLRLARSADLRAAWDARARRGPALLGGLAFGVILILAPLTLLDWLRTLFRDSADYRYAAYAARLAPLCNWLALLGLLLVVVVMLADRAALADSLGAERAALRRWGGFALAAGLLAALAAWTGIGFSGDTLGSWGNPDVPLLEWQIGLALLVTLAAALALDRLPARWQPARLDLALGLLIWVVAALLWTSQPLVPGYFATPGRAPNFEIYPFSDGQTYDQYAQSILVGDGLMGAIPQRPLYIVFLALLHLLAGQDYLKVIFVQQIVLAALPALLYGIGKELHSRPAGILAAGLVTLRELTAIRAAPFTDNISYSKLYFSELPTALCLAAFTFFALRWIKGIKTGRRWPLDALLAGGFMGMAMLIRTQSLAALPLALLLALVVAWQDGRDGNLLYTFSGGRGWLRGVLLAGVGVGICVLPWLARNVPIAGGLAFDNADSQTLVLAQRYNNLNFDAPIPRQPGEKEAHYSSRLVQMAVSGMVRDPASAAWYIANHWMNNEIDNLLIFPLRFTLSSPAELAWPSSPFWQAWSGRLTFPQWLLLAANLALLAAGLAGAVRQAGAAGWLPLLVNLAYNLSTAVFRSSGGRFLLPVDWTALLLYALGWAQVLVWAWTLAGKAIPRLWVAAQSPTVPVGAAPQTFRHAMPGLAAAALAFLLVGLSLPLSERVFPRRYPPAPSAQIAASLLQALPGQGGDAANASLQALSQQPGAVLLRGRALYPRFYAAGQNEPKTAKTGYAGLPYARLVFYLVGERPGLVVLPLDQSPAVFPNAADVLILGCAETGYTRAAAVVVGNPGAAYRASGPLCAP